MRSEQEDWKEQKASNEEKRFNRIHKEEDVPASGALERRASKRPRKRRLEAPCVRGCPAGIDVPRYIGYLALGKFAEAKAVVRERIPLPSICSHVCYRTCEPPCRRVRMDKPVAVNALKRAAVEYGGEMEIRYPEEGSIPDTGKRVAVVGSGPGGLTAAYYLARRCGHRVTVFEALPQAGGQLRVGIPDFRLPGEVLDGEIADIVGDRVSLETGVFVDNLDELLARGFHAVLIATGAMKPKRLGILGEDLAGVRDCVGFLQLVNLGEKMNIGPRVAIIGGGNVAIDGARTARRLGGREVRILYRRTRQEMPAYSFEAEAAEEEGVNIDLLMSPTTIRQVDQGLEINLIRMKLGKPDASGRRRPVPVPKSDIAVRFDTVLVAIGQGPAVPPCWGLELNPDGTIKIHQKTLETSRAGVFACGDVISGPSNVIEAIAGGRLAVETIDRFLGGAGDITEQWAPDSEEEMVYPVNMYSCGVPPFPQRRILAEDRVLTFEEVDQGLTLEDAVREARRCIRCDLWRREGVPLVWPKRRKTGSLQETV